MKLSRGRAWGTKGGLGVGRGNRGERRRGEQVNKYKRYEEGMKCPSCKQPIKFWELPICPHCRFDLSAIEQKTLDPEMNQENQKSEIRKTKTINRKSTHRTDNFLDTLQIVGLLLFFLFLLISIVQFVSANDIAETEYYSNFPYYVWKVTKAIWWLLLSFAGLIVALFGWIAEELSNNKKS
ncbi:MAG: hypothetical protein NTW14_09965 [bacterium]|nr:hypothetical protein [bacterium]